MPEGYAHVRTAKKAAAAIHYKLKCPEAFAAGANGPDSFFCYQIWRKPAKRSFNLPQLGQRMHEGNTGAFLQSLLCHVKTGAQVEYALGFLSHYATDTVVHPYVFAVCEAGQPYAGKGGHGYFEAALDSTLHAEDTGISQVPAEDTSPPMPAKDLAEVCALLHTCVQEVYGLDVPVEYFADAFYDVYRCRRLFTSRHGLRKGVFWVVEIFFGGRGFITGHVTPRTLKTNLPESWRNPFTGEEKQGGVFALLKQAQTFSEQLMNGALQNWIGVLPDADLQRLIGSKSYTEGRATPDSDPALKAAQEAEKQVEAAKTSEAAPEAAEAKTDNKAEAVKEENPPEKLEVKTEEKPEEKPTEDAAAQA